jgi:heme/copper-type cytochrome/quinol oxidase subunit 2
MGSTGLVILLVVACFLVVVGINATSNLVDEANTSNDSEIANAASGAGATMGSLWTVFGICIIIIGAYAVINAYSKM